MGQRVQGAKDDMSRRWCLMILILPQDNLTISCCDCALRCCSPLRTTCRVGQMEEQRQSPAWQAQPRENQAGIVPYCTVRDYSIWFFQCTVRGLSNSVFPGLNFAQIIFSMGLDALIRATCQPLLSIRPIRILGFVACSLAHSCSKNLQVFTLVRY